jgi:hypothetical protein
VLGVVGWVLRVGYFQTLDIATPIVVQPAAMASIFTSKSVWDALMRSSEDVISLRTSLKKAIPTLAEYAKEYLALHKGAKENTLAVKRRA